MSFGLTLVTPPTEEPLSLEEAKLHLRVDWSDEDDLISGLIEASRQMVEHKLERALMPQTWALTLDFFPYEMSSETYRPNDRDMYARIINAYSITIPMGGITGVTSVVWQTDNGTQTVTSDGLIVDTSKVPVRVYPKAGSWPYNTQTIPAAITVAFEAGEWTPDSCPRAIKQAMLLLIGHWYRSREAVTDTKSVTLPLAVDALLAPFKVHLC